MTEKFTAQWPLPGGDSLYYTATDGFACDQLREITRICGFAVANEAPQDAFGCNIITTELKDMYRPMHPANPEVVAWQDNFCALNLHPGKKKLDAYIYETTSPTPEKFGFLWRRIFYAGVLTKLIRAESFFVHGILAEYNGNGIIISGPSGVGKSTAARRLPPPWRVASDDCLLVTRTPDGFFAQPVPTWSIYFAKSAPPRIYDSKEILPLRGVYLLDRGADYAEQLNKLQATVGFTKSICDMTGISFGHNPPPEAAGWYKIALNAGLQLVDSVPCYHLFATLHGRFWDALESTLEANPHG